MAQAGRYRHLVRLQQRVFTSDGQGGSTEGWTTIDEIHVQVRSGGGTEVQHAGQLTSTNVYSVRMRWRDRFTPAQRVLWIDGDTDRILDVLSSSNPDDLRRELVLVCVERTPDAGVIGS